MSVQSGLAGTSSRLTGIVIQRRPALFLDLYKSLWAFNICSVAKNVSVRKNIVSIQKHLLKKGMFFSRLRFDGNESNLLDHILLLHYAHGSTEKRRRAYGRQRCLSNYVKTSAANKTFNCGTCTVMINNRIAMKTERMKT